MQRGNWAFSYSNKSLADGARKKVEHHTARLKFWCDAKDKVMAEVKDSGIEVSESEAGGTYSNRTTGMGPQVMVRTDLQRRLTECHQKIVEHTGKVAEYEGWVEVLEGTPQTQLPLNSDDYLYFFGKK